MIRRILRTNGAILPNPMRKLKVKLLDPHATVPTVAHPGEDLGFDLYALEESILLAGIPTKVRTGVAVEMPGYGFIIRDRSSMAMKGVTSSGGVIDAGYRGEMFVNLTYNPRPGAFYWDAFKVIRGDKIGQFIPIKPATDGEIIVVAELTDSSRGAAGYGSSGR